MKSNIAVAYVYERPDFQTEQKGFKWINIHVISTGSSRTIKEYQRLHKNAVTLFPFLKDEEGQCQVVTDSGSFKYAAILTYGCSVPIDQVFPTGNNCYHFDTMNPTYKYI